MLFCRAKDELALLLEAARFVRNGYTLWHYLIDVPSRSEQKDHAAEGG